MRFSERYYTPPARIAEVDGLERVQKEKADFWTSGTRAQLVATGLVSESMFPGEPGLPQGMVEYWVEGVPRNGPFTPGLLTINKLPSGRYTLKLVVSEAEQRRRCDAVESRRRADAISQLRRALASAQRLFGDDMLREALAGFVEPSCAAAPSPGRPSLRLVHGSLQPQSPPVQ